MNKDQAKGTLKDTAGKLIGSNEQQLKGIKKQVEGHAQKGAGEVKEVVKASGRK